MAVPAKSMRRMMSSTGAKGFRWSTRCTRHPCVTRPVLLGEAPRCAPTPIGRTARGPGQRMRAKLIRRTLGRSPYLICGPECRGWGGRVPFEGIFGHGQGRVPGLTHST